MLRQSSLQEGLAIPVQHCQLHSEPTELAQRGSGSGDPQAGRGAGTGCAAQEVGGRARAWAEKLGSAGFSSEREQGTSIHEICVNRT